MAEGDDSGAWMMQQALLQHAPQARPPARRKPSEVVRFWDAFAGGGGANQGTEEALHDLGLEGEHWLLNHWEVAVATLRENFPGATVIHDPIETTEARKIAPGKKLRLATWAPPCPHFSRAKGGQPRDDGQRSTVIFCLRVLDELIAEGREPEDIVIENVEDFEKWGPVDPETRKPIKAREGEDFRWLLNELRHRGYTYVQHRRLNAADFGAPTTRVRLFIIARKNRPVRWPQPTHSNPKAKGGLKPGTKPWVPALSVIDLGISGKDLWERPLARNTMARIAVGFRKKGPLWGPVADSLDAYVRAYDVAYAVALRDAHRQGLRDKAAKNVARKAGAEAGAGAEGIGPVPLRKLLDAAVGQEEVDRFLADLEQFMLMSVTHGGREHDPKAPLPTVTGAHRGEFRIAHPAFTLGEHGGAMPRAGEDPMATITGGGALQLILNALVLPPKGRNGDLLTSNVARELTDVLQAFTQRCGQTRVVTAMLELAEGATMTPGHRERDGQAARHMDPSERPAWTVTASGAGLLAFVRFLVGYYKNGRTHAETAPIPTLTTKDRYAWVVAVLDGLMVTIHTRMLQPHELAAAMGFPASYKFTGTKTDITMQIGNAWPVPVGRAIVRTLLEGDLDEALVRVTPKRPEGPRHEDATGVRVYKPRPSRGKRVEQAQLPTGPVKVVA